MVSDVPARATFNAPAAATPLVAEFELQLRTQENDAVAPSMHETSVVLKIMTILLFGGCFSWYVYIAPPQIARNFSQNNSKTLRLKFFPL